MRDFLIIKNKIQDLIEKGSAYKYKKDDFDLGIHAILKVVKSENGI